MCKLKENMNSIEVMIRFYISIFFIVMSVSYTNYLFLVFPIILIYTALKKRCFIYGVLGINKNLNKEDKYKSLLLLHNESSVYIFDDTGKILFNNKIANDTFENIQNFSDFEIDLEKEEISTKEEDKITYNTMYEYNNMFYQINIQKLIDEKYILMYITDVIKVQLLNQDIKIK